MQRFQKRETIPSAIEFRNATATTGLTGELNKQRKSGAARRVATEAIRMARQDNITFTLYTLQNAGIGTLDREDEFEAARELIIQSNLPDPTKDLELMGGMTWLKLIKFANENQTDLSSKVAVYDCLHAFFTESKQPTEGNEWQRFSYEEKTQLFQIFRDAPNVTVAIAAISRKAGNEFKAGMEFATWLNQALQEAGISTSIGIFENPEILPRGVSIHWRKNVANNDMAQRLIKAVALKGLTCFEVPGPATQDSEVNLMVGAITKPAS